MTVSIVVTGPLLVAGDQDVGDAGAPVAVHADAVPFDGEAGGLEPEETPIVAPLARSTRKPAASPIRN